MDVKQQRDIEVDWRPFSLTLKNDELHGKDTTGHADTHLLAHKVLRVIEAVYAGEGTDRGELYTAFGKAYYVDKQANDDYIATVLRGLGLEKYTAEADNSTWDQFIDEHLQSAIEIVGNDVGVPLIVFTSDAGDQQGYFGPVLQGLPDTEEGLKLWDGLQNLATSKHFFELKRGRSGGAMPGSTARMFDGDWHEK